MSTRYGTAKQIEDAKSRLKSYKSVKEDPYRYGLVENKGEFTKNLAQAEKTLATIVPPETTGADRDRLAARQSQLEQFIVKDCAEIRKPAMVPHSAMWDKPTGAVDQHLLWERSIQNYTVDSNGKPTRAKDGYGAFDEWKDNERRLNAGDDAIDMSNIEKLRPANEQSRSFIDRPSMTFAAANPAVTEEAFDEAVGVPEERRCNGLRGNGEQCGSRSLLNSQFCRHHQPKAPEPPAA